MTGRTNLLSLIAFLSLLIISNDIFGQQQIVVDQSGQGDHTTIQSALDVINGTTLTADVEVLIRSGEYFEQLTLQQVDNSTSDYSVTIRSESGNAEDVVIRNSDTVSFGTRLLTMKDVSHLTVEHLTFEGMGIVYQEGFFSLGSGLSDLRFDSNIFRNETSSPIYAFLDNFDFTSETDTIKNLVIRNNLFSEVIAVTMYYQSFKGVLFEDNIIEDLVYDNSGSVTTWLDFTDLTIKGNEYHGSTAGSFINCKNVSIFGNFINSDEGGMILSATSDEGHSDYKIYNNFIIAEDLGITILFNGIIAEVTNNNFLISGNSSGASIALNTFYDTEIYNKVTVLNNVFYSSDKDNLGVLMYRSPDSLKIDTVIFDYNNYYAPDEFKSWRILNQQYIDYTIDELRSEYGFETNGLSVDPLYQSETDLHIANVALKDQGTPVDYILEDYDGETREGDPDIGADELQGFVNLTPSGTLDITGNLMGGKNIQVKYMVENEGTLRLGGAWKDALYLSTDDELDESDLLLAEFTREFLLEAGEIYEGDESIKLPVSTAGGNHYLLLRVNDEGKEFDRNLTDNVLSSNSLTFEDPIFPNLEVTEVITPETQFSGKSFELQWTVMNTGTGPTTDNWQDYVYVANQAVSLDDPGILDSDSLFLKRVSAPVSLNPGESYQQTLNTNIPLRYSGTLYYRIQADGGQNITETDTTFSNNGLTSDVVNITQSPLPDLAVTQLGIPSTAFSGDKVGVNWTVENVGQQTTYRTSVQLHERDWLNRANYNYWKDYVYISKKPWYDEDEPTQRVVARYYRGTEELEAGARYTIEDSIRFDICEYGWYYVFVRANDDQYTYELSRNNNINIVDSIELIIDPQPDMLPTDLSITGSPLSGRALDISYTIKNEGFADKPENLLMNYFYVSSLDTLNEEESIFIGLESNTDPIAQDDSYSGTVSLDLPFEEFGDYYLYLKTDAEDNICEVQGETNNVISIPIEIQLSDQPDLVPELYNLPDTLYAGSNYTLNYSVFNDGAAAAVQDAWYDRMLFGYERVYSKRHAEPLEPGGSYNNEIRFTVDLWKPEGSVFMRLFADWNDNLFEYGGEDNNIFSREVYISRDSSRVPDLSLESFEIVNSSLTAGDMLEIDYTILNKSAETPQNGWTDQVRLLDEDGNTVWKQDVKHLGNISRGELYAGTHVVQLPYTIGGNYEIELVLNNNLTLVEYVTENNTGSKSANIIEYTPPDIEVDDVQYASCCNLFALQEDEITIDILNNGPGIIENTSFTIKVWLAEDAAGSNSRPLLVHRQAYDISSNSSTSVTIPVQFDANLSGDYFTIVELDTEEEIYEGKKTANNRYVTGYTVYIDNEPMLLYPGGIDILSETDPFNKSMRIAYDVDKDTDKQLLRTMEDQIVLSKDRKYDGEDYRFRELFPTYRNIAAGISSFKDTLYGYIPTYLNPGWYYVGVMVDAKNNVLELDETNNVLFTTDSFYLDFTVPLELDQPTELSFYEGTVGGQEAFSLDRPAGKGMITTVDFSEDQASTELYHRVGRMPTTSTFDNRYSDPFLADQEVIVPVTDTSVKDYMRVIANRVPWINNSPLDFLCWTSYLSSGSGNVMTFLDPGCLVPDKVPYTITAKSAEYSIIRSVPDSASFLGTSNLLLQGFDFEDGMQFYMTNGSDTIHARRVTVTSSTEAVGVFDFRERNAGSYDIVAVKESGETTVLEDNFTVFEGYPPITWTSVNHSIRTELINKKFYVNVDFGNYGYVNGYDYWLIFAVATKSGNLDNLSSTYIGSSVEEFYEQFEEHPNPPGDSGYVDIEGIRYYAYWIPVLPPRSQTTFTYIIDSKEEDYILTQARMIEQPLSMFKFKQDIDYIDQSVTVAKLTDVVFEGATSTSETDPLDNTKKALGGLSALSNGDFNCDDLNIQKVQKEIAHNVQGVAERVHGGAQATKGARNVSHAVKLAIESKRKALADDVQGAFDIRGNAEEAAKDLAKKKLVKMVKKEESLLDNAKGYATEFYNSVNPESKLKEAIQPEEVPFEELLNKTFSCIDPGEVEDQFNKCYHGSRHQDGSITYGPVNNPDCNHPPGTFDSDGTDVVESKDPNEIIGPAGVTSARLINTSEVLKYTIYFENMPEASAPARYVSVNNILPDGLRPQSFVLTSFGFGDTLIQVEPTNRLNYRMELGKKYNYQDLEVLAGIDIVNNRAFWRFSTIEPETGNLTQDPLNGFLPPNDSTGIGQGYVTYEIRLESDVEAGTEILNQADIVFDQNEVISTNTWSNVVVSSDPSSEVNDLPEIMEDSTFTITWEGIAGNMSAGILGYDIYVAQDEQPYQILLESTTDTSTVFTGIRGSDYSFYSVMVTLDGTREKAPGTPDAFTTIYLDTTNTDTTNTDTTQVGIQLFPDESDNAVFNAKVYPNPASENLWVAYSASSEVRLRLVDLSGRILYSEQLQAALSTRKVLLNLEEYKKGVLILQLSNDQEVKNIRIIKTE